MALTTRCPQCGTSFKVVPDQLRVRNGLVRCGACSTVFDGRACLVPAPGAPVASTAPASAPLPSSAAAVAAPVLSAPEPHPPAASIPEPAFPPVSRVDPVPAPAFPPAVMRGRDDIRRRAEPQAIPPDDDADDADYVDDDEPFLREPDPPRTSSAPHRSEPIVARRSAEPPLGWQADRQHDDVRDAERDDEYEIEDDDLDHGPHEPVLGDARTRYSSTTDVGRAPPEFLDQDRIDRNGLLRRLWGYACLVGLIALGLQLLYAYRTDIANSAPALRPALEAACKPLDCTVGYARRRDLISISSSSLQPPAGAAAIDDGRTRLVLTVMLHNRYDKPQHWPALVLELNDLSDTVVVRKVLMPENYLTPQQLSGPFEAQGALKISVPIEVTGVQVNGYQLDKFFP